MKLTRIVLKRYKFRNVHVPAPELTAPIGKYTKDYANLPERYLVRKTAKIMHKSDDHVSYQTRLNKWEAQYHGYERPWTDKYWRENAPFHEEDQPDIVEPIREQDWMWFRGDRVELLTGDDKGKQGYIVYIVQERNWVYVEGLNCKYITDGATSQHPGFMHKEEKPLLVTTDVKLVDPSDEQGCEVEWRFTEDGQRVRVSTRTDHVLPVPSQAFSTKDYKTKAGYKESDVADTKPADVEEITYEPQLATFDMDIMKHYGIEEKRAPRKTFWY
jgi:large subunit ribosomal protein L24